MKKIAALCLALLLAAGGILFVSASETSYKLEKIGASVAVPEGMKALKYPVQEGDPNLSGLGIDAAAANSMFETLGTLLRVELSGGNGEIVVNYVENDGVKSVSDFRLYEEKEFESQFASLKEEGEKLAVPVHYLDYRVEDFHAGRFMTLNFTSAEEASNRIAGKQYYTVVNGKGVSVILRARGAEAEAYDEMILTQMVESMSFDELSIGPSGAEEDKLVQQKRTAVTVMGMVLAGVLALGLIITAVILYQRKKAAGTPQNHNDYGDELPHK